MSPMSSPLVPWMTVVRSHSASVKALMVIEAVAPFSYSMLTI